MTHIKHLLMSTALLLNSAIAWAQSSQATWSILGETAAKPHIYAGQEIALALDLYTPPNHSLKLRISDLLPSSMPILTVEKQGDQLRHRFTWHQTYDKAQEVTLPAGQLTVELSKTFQSGFFTQTTTNLVSRAIERFSFQVNPLPPQPESMTNPLIGNFNVSVHASKPTFFVGDVLQVTSVVTAVSGSLPTDFMPHIDLDVKQFKVYPPKLVSRTQKSIAVAQLVVPLTETSRTITAPSIACFDTKKGTYTQKTGKPITLLYSPPTESDQIQDISVIATETKDSQPLYFAPSTHSFAIGTLQASDPYTILETLPVDATQSTRIWTHIRTATQSGWILLAPTQKKVSP